MRASGDAPSPGRPIARLRRRKPRNAPRPVDIELDPRSKPEDDQIIAAGRALGAKKPAGKPAKKAPKRAKKAPAKRAA